MIPPGIPLPYANATYEVSQGFNTGGTGGSHKDWFRWGIDFKMPYGSDVRAVMGGEIVAFRQDVEDSDILPGTDRAGTGNGNYLIIRTWVNGEPVYTNYSHLVRNFLLDAFGIGGARSASVDIANPPSLGIVQMGDFIGKTGKTGIRISEGGGDGAHLHIHLGSALYLSGTDGGLIVDGRADVSLPVYFAAFPSLTGPENAQYYSQGSFAPFQDVNNRFYGGSGADSIAGTSRDEVFYGGAGNDTFIVGAGRDIVYGGDGFDTVIIDTSRDSNIITRVGNIILIDHPSEQKTLSDVEVVRFNDMNVLVGWLPEAITIRSGNSINHNYSSPTLENLLVSSSSSQSTFSVTPESIGWSFASGAGSLLEFLRGRLQGGAQTLEGTTQEVVTLRVAPTAPLLSSTLITPIEPATRLLSISTNYNSITVEGVGVVSMADILATSATDDHGNTYTNATQIGSGAITGYTSASGTIEVRGDTDWFSVTLQAGRTYAFMLSSAIGSGLDPFLTLRLPNGTVITNDDLSATTLTSFISFTAPVAGTYYLEARGTASTTGSYFLTATPLNVATPGPDPVVGPEPNDPYVNNSFWHWQGTSGHDDFGSSLNAIQNMGLDPYSDLRLRGHNGSDDIVGGRGNDLIWGDSGRDELDGGWGNDTIRGGTHSDTVYGNYDHDLIFGETGDDLIYGGEGFDTIFGGDGSDTLYGANDTTQGSGQNTYGENYIKGEGGDDLIFGGWESDILFGDEGNDTVFGGAYDDTIYGGLGNDWLYGETDEDWIAGEAGHDRLFGGAGYDTLYGGDGNDTLMGGPGNDILHGEGGIDTADFSDGVAGVTVNLFDEIAISTDLGQDRLYEIENVIGSAGNDVIDADHGANIIWGDAGNDRIRGHNGNDTLYGGTGEDTLWGDQGDDIVYGDAGNDELRGGLGNDTIYGGSGDDHIRGEQGNDLIYGGEGVDTVFFWGQREDFSFIMSPLGVLIASDIRPDGLEGQDTLDGIELVQFFNGIVNVENLLAPSPVLGADVAETSGDIPILIDVLENDAFGSLIGSLVSVKMAARDGNAHIVDGRVLFDPRGFHDDMSSGLTRVVDLIYVAQSSALVSRTGTLSITISAQRGIPEDIGPVQITGTSGNDALAGNAGNDTLDGGLGSDTLDGAGGNDLIFGGGSGDFLYGGIGNDTIYGGEGRDYIEGGAGDDVLYGDTGADTIQGGDGHDRLEGQTGRDSLIGGSGNDTLQGGSGSDTLNGGSGDDSLAGGSGRDLLLGGSGQDILNGGSENDTMYGRSGNDALHGASGDDLLDGGTGNDVLEGGSGADTLIGAAGNDTLIGGSGADVFVFDEAFGNDVVTDFQNGIDRFDFRAHTAGSFMQISVGNVGVNAIISDGAGNTILVLSAAGLIDYGDFIF